MKEILERKEKLNKQLLNLEKNMTMATYTALQSSVGDFFTEFEESLCKKTYNGRFLSKLDIDDSLTSIENILDFAIEYKTLMDLVGGKFNRKINLQKNFLRTSESLLNRYRKKSAEIYREKFENVGLPTMGFDHQITFPQKKIDWKSIIVGVICLAVATYIAFFCKINSGYQNLIFRFFFSAGAACLLSGTCKGFIEVHIKTKPIIITAIGGMAIFVMTYLVNPPPPPDYDNPSKQSEQSVDH